LVIVDALTLLILLGWVCWKLLQLLVLAIVWIWKEFFDD